MGPTSRVPESEDLGWGRIICISNDFPNDADTIAGIAGSEITTRPHLENLGIMYCIMRSLILE